MSELSELIIQLRDEYVEKQLVSNFEEINCGYCVDFADEIEFRMKKPIGTLSNDHFIVESEDSDGWNGDERDIWDEKWLKEYNSMPPNGIKVEELTNLITGYHYWIYEDGKHYDSECPEGVENMFDLPFFKRKLSDQRSEEFVD